MHFLTIPNEQKVNPMKNMSLKNAQSGFTLVEIAIVLVIIGLLLGGVLKGTELIENAKVKKAINEINGVTSAFYAYQDRYKQLPGDDGPTASIQARGGSWATLAGGNANGVIATTYAQTFGPAGETMLVWQHLRAANLLSGDPLATTITSLPRNAFGGLIGFTALAVGSAPALGARVVCLSQVPGKSAAAIDTAMDDGNGDTGKVRGLPGAVGVNTAPAAATPGPTIYSEPVVYTLCAQM
jgi:prepilin-type N-terminal cleavage/methylation domain-containing protein